MSVANRYCERFGIQVPRLEVAKNSPDASYYSLLIVALLERGEPITLAEAAQRFEAAGVAPWRDLPSRIKGRHERWITLSTQPSPTAGSRSRCC
jgi:hypothetical protein